MERRDVMLKIRCNKKLRQRFRTFVAKSGFETYDTALEKLLIMADELEKLLERQPDLATEHPKLVVKRWT